MSGRNEIHEIHILQLEIVPITSTNLPRRLISPEGRSNPNFSHDSRHNDQLRVEKRLAADAGNRSSLDNRISRRMIRGKKKRGNPADDHDCREDRGLKSRSRRVRRCAGPRHAAITLRCSANDPSRLNLIFPFASFGIGYRVAKEHHRDSCQTFTRKRHNSRPRFLPRDSSTL